MTIVGCSSSFLNGAHSRYHCDLPCRVSYLKKRLEERWGKATPSPLFPLLLFPSKAVADAGFLEGGFYYNIAHEARAKI